MQEKRKQPGVEFPSATKQEHILIIRLNISRQSRDDKDRDIVRDGLRRLCNLLEKIDRGIIKVDDLNEVGDIKRIALSEFNFSATLGFGIGFFEKLKISLRNRPRNLLEMPNHIGLSDSKPYELYQTDLLIQSGSNFEDVNRWVFQHKTARSNNDVKKLVRIPNFGANRLYNPGSDDDEVYSIISDWAAITDIHRGFQRIDGRNLLGFNDGISNPKRLSNDTTWTTIKDEDDKFVDGTYMVFQKIEHDLDRWRSMPVDKQEEWIGRSKGTGLFLGYSANRSRSKGLLRSYNQKTPVSDKKHEGSGKNCMMSRRTRTRTFLIPSEESTKTFRYNAQFGLTYGNLIQDGQTVQLEVSYLDVVIFFRRGV